MFLKIWFSKTRITNIALGTPINRLQVKAPLSRIWQVLKICFLVSYKLCKGKFEKKSIFIIFIFQADI